MRKIGLVFLLVLVLFGGAAFAQDNIYGDYYLATFGKKVSLDLEDARLVDVLKMLSQQTKLNFISTDAVQDRNLTLYMAGVPLKEAMDMIFKANNLAYDYYPDSNMFIVKEMGKPALELKTKVYPLRYSRLMVSRMTSEIDTILKWKEAGEESEEGGGGEGGGGGAAVADDVGIKVAVESVLSENGTVEEDPVTNSLVVTDVPSQFPLIEEVISKLDIPPIKVLLEVEMLDVSKKHLDKIGFNLANGLYGSYVGPARPTTFPWTERLFKGTLTNPTAATGEDVPLLGLMDLTGFTAVMQFITQDTTTRSLARPKVLTINNEVAQVGITVDEVTGIIVTRDAGGQTTEEPERHTTGTRLRITPQVNPLTDEITMVIEVFNRESEDSGISSEQLTGNYKNIEERGLRNVVRLKSGETLFIGGLIRKNEEETIKKIPLLGDIPLVGNFFRFKQKLSEDNIDRELLVFITPRIVDERHVVSKPKKIIPREQANTVRSKSIRFALDKLSR